MIPVQRYLVQSCGGCGGCGTCGTSAAGGVDTDVVASLAHSPLTHACLKHDQCTG